MEKCKDCYHFYNGFIHSGARVSCSLGYIDAIECKRSTSRWLDVKAINITSKDMEYRFSPEFVSCKGIENAR
jgi:hypothetical protein